MSISCPRYDFHIHTARVGCAVATMEIPTIVEKCEQRALTAIAITDHADRPEELQANLQIKRDLEEIDTNIDLFFGIEASYVGPDHEFFVDEQIKEAHGFQFVIGGLHATYIDEYDPAKIFEVQHRYYLEICQNPLIDVLAHPYWFSSAEFQAKGWPRFDSMSSVPPSYARELGQAAKETCTAIEINGGSVSPLNRSDLYIGAYVDHLALVAEQGPNFSIGSDAHEFKSLERMDAAWTVPAKIGIGAPRIWRPPCAPFNA